MDFVPVSHLWYRAVEIAFAQRLQAVCAADNGSCDGTINHNGGDQYDNDTKYHTEDKLHHISHICIVHKFIFIQVNGNTPSVGSGNGGIALNIVGIVGGVIKAIHTALAGYHFLFNGT